MTFLEVDKLLTNNGWIRDKKGNASSHIIYRKGNSKVPVPNHTRDIPKGTLNAIIKQTGLK